MPRRAVKWLLFILAGAIVNIAVAWGLAIAVNPYKGDYSDEWLQHSPGDISIVFVFQNAGSTAVQVQQYRSRKEEIPGKVIDASLSERIPAWAKLDLQPFMKDGVTRRILDARGWPMLALCSEFVHVPVRQGENPSYQSWQSFRVGSGIETGLVAYSGRPVPIQRVLPLRMLWPGFAINTMFYAGAIWLLFCGPFTLRRAIRRRRGRCVACGYPVGVSPICTECGAAVTPRISRDAI